MPNLNVQYFTTSEFARICGVTKHTLFHYDEIGLFCPQHIGKNGYRYYTVKQFYQFDMITILKRAGTPLKEIKEFIRNQNPKYFVNLLKEKEAYLEQEKRKIDRMQQLLLNTIRTTTTAMCEKYGVPRLEFCEEEYFMVMEVPKERDERISLKAVADYFNYCEKQSYNCNLSLGGIIGEEKLVREEYTEPDYYCIQVDQPYHSEKMHCKPRGMYVVMFHQGDYNALPQSYRMMVQYLSDQQMEICGNAYEYDMLNYLAVSDPEKYVIQISIQCQPRDESR